MTYRGEILRLLDQISGSEISSSAYDTAWVARLAVRGESVGLRALEWLRQHQLNDGTWGAEQPRYYHDRLICTLASAIALVVNHDSQDAERIQRAKDALVTVIEDLRSEMVVETIGFELIIPTLFREAERLGIVQQKDYAEMSKLHAVRQKKLSRLPDGMINRHVTLAFSAEMAGTDEIDLLDIAHLQQPNGSIGNSPAATAYYLLHIHSDDQSALEYLRRSIQADGAVPDVTPINLFERLWSMWHIALLCTPDSEIRQACQHHLDFIQKCWIPGRGMGMSSDYLTDSDVTSVAYDVLQKFGQQPDVNAILSYEESEYFRCYSLEANPSISANIHVLHALRVAGLPPHHPSVQKIKTFLHGAAIWFDKWHVSPYYATGHGIIAAAGYLDSLVEDAVEWIIGSQNADGSWGYFLPTAEETAYALHALVSWHRAGHKIPEDTLVRGAAWLEPHLDAPYPPLWIGKCLYTPILVVRATVLSALMSVNEIIAEETLC